MKTQLGLQIYLLRKEVKLRKAAPKLHPSNKLIRTAFDRSPYELTQIIQTPTSLSYHHRPPSQASSPLQRKRLWFEYQQQLPFPLIFLNSYTHTYTLLFLAVAIITNSEPKEEKGVGRSDPLRATNSPSCGREWCSPDGTKINF